MDRLFTILATSSSRLAGRPVTFVIATLLTVLWAVTGPIFHYSDTWQLVINTATTVLTFLIVFLIQNSQNRDSAAMQAKLDELLRAVEKARSDFIAIEHLTDTQIEQIRDALERETGNATDKQGTADDTVDQLLKRY